MLCQCPKLSPLQSRFIASAITLIFLGFVYWSFFNPHFAYASELDLDGTGLSRNGADHNWHRIQQEMLEEDGIDVLTDGEEVEMMLQMRRVEEVDEAVMEEKRATNAMAMAIDDNNSPNQMNILAGNTTVWFYSNDLRNAPPAPEGSGLPSGLGDKSKAQNNDLDKRGGLEKRQNGATTVYISINTCVQPEWNGTGVQTDAPPQLTLYVSTTSSNTTPGPNGSNSTQIAVPLDKGFANATVQADSGIYMSINAPALPDGFTGVWNYELAVSTEDYYHSADLDDPFLFLVDTDTNSALLVTDNLTQADSSDPIFKKWMNISTPFIMFAANVNHTASMGMENSFCGWSKIRQIEAQQSDPEGIDTGVQMGMITRGLGRKPKEQFYITNLNRSSEYNGVLAMEGNSTKAGKGVVGGGGKVWQPVQWTTKSDGNCALLFNLTFCDEVAYAVPSNPKSFNITGMRNVFDNYTSTMYQNFNYSLAQIPCNTTSEAQYSLAKTCTDCASAYKTWLCAVSIPRCQDFSNPDPSLQPRNVGQAFLNNTYLPSDYLTMNYVPMLKAPTLEGSPRDTQTFNTSLATNSSRNPTIIDDMIQPGPYKEVLPCEDLCWGLMQSCPASLGFACPHRGRGLEATYGRRSPDGSLTCSFLGAVYNTNGVGGLAAPFSKVVAGAVILAFVLMVV
ncbi:Hypothetical protein R9X50_00693700 [Acrodontium crateriforme]|uniref:Uncharacterized protein n=1 Tax=Acrodontium crateriforme TaxID=150365 RepID=A0AAQ3MB04_9PEZI|nr:Hypothetical protein R9X50_00693700 [Acrodontium crateriforme]